MEQRAMRVACLCMRATNYERLRNTVKTHDQSRPSRDPPRACVNRFSQAGHATYPFCSLRGCCFVPYVTINLIVSLV